MSCACALQGAYDVCHVRVCGVLMCNDCLLVGDDCLLVGDDCLLVGDD